MDSLYTDELFFQVNNDVTHVELSSEAYFRLSVSMILYGRGKGIHGLVNFKSYNLEEFLAHFADRHSAKNLKNGKIIFHGAERYCAFFTLSEIMDRNDGGKVIWTKKRNKGGQYSILPTFDCL